MDDNIWSGSGYMDFLPEIIELCGLNFKEYCEDESILTREILEKNLDMLIDTYDDPDNPDEIIGLQMIGCLILDLGATLPQDLKRAIIWSIDEKLDTLVGDKGWGGDWDQ